MFLLGHMGITIVIIYLLVVFLSKKMPGYFKGISLQSIDFRVVIILAVLPDIIDKIVGMIIFKDEIGTGRAVAHTAVFNVLITLIILAIVRYKLSNPLKIVFYTLPVWLHLTLDRIWESPKVVLWPLFGSDFPRSDVEIGDFFTMLLSDNYVLAGEILGVILILFLLFRHKLYITTRLAAFIKKGKFLA